MAKRFTDTEIWNKTWYYNLPLKHKLLWKYMCDNCDLCGVWDPNLELASAHIGKSVEFKEDDLSVFGNRIKILENGDVFIVDFVRFQYGELLDCNGRANKSRVHQAVMSCLKKHGIAYPIDRDSIV